jgi:hypothetical protein
MKLANLWLLSLPLISACVGNSVITTGTLGDEIDAEDVRVYFAYEAACEHEVIGIIEVNGLHFSRESITDRFRAKAAMLGANAVHINYLQKRDVGEFLGQARAIRCVVRSDA